MGLRFFLVAIAVLAVKALILFVAWNHVFVNMLTVLKPISLGMAFAAMFAWGLLTFTFTYKES